jgi:hypothetical protein
MQVTTVFKPPSEPPNIKEGTGYQSLGIPDGGVPAVWPCEVEIKTGGEISPPRPSENCMGAR